VVAPPTLRPVFLAVDTCGVLVLVRFRASATAFRSTTITDDDHLLPKVANFIINKTNPYAKSPTDLPLQDILAQTRH